ncbi:MAG: hypothetical protein WCT10_03650 [Patescibacteria group bacterium]|jgi:hypothetical protein
MNKNWHWLRLPGWFEINDLDDDDFGDDYQRPPEGSLMLVKPTAMAMISVMTAPWIGNAQLHYLAERIAASMRAKKGLLLGLIDTTGKDEFEFVWTSGDGLNSGKTFIHLDPNAPSMILLINAIWPSDQDPLDDEANIIAASIRSPN